MMREEAFELIRKQFLEVPETEIDEKIRDIVFFFKTSSVNDIVVPRWSCQSHDVEVHKTYNIIFFYKNELGKKVIEDMFKDVHLEYIKKYGVSYTASVHMEIMYLLSAPDYRTPFEHLQISFGCDGFDISIQHAHDVWLKVLLEKYQ